MFMELIKQHCEPAGAADATSQASNCDEALLGLLNVTFWVICSNKPFFADGEILKLARFLPLSDNQAQKAILAAAVATGEHQRCQSRPYLALELRSRSLGVHI